MVVVTIDIYEDITPGLESRVRDALPVDGPVTVRINSYGGAVDVGNTIRNLLTDHQGHVTCVVDGVAASAASVIAVAGSDELVMREGSELMIHRASLGAGGNATALRGQADRLEKIDQQLAQVYATKAGGTPDHWMQVMEEEPWYSAEEAVAVGLADRIEGRAVQALSVERIAAQYNYRGRREPPTIQRKDNHMSLKALADELGWSAADLKSAFNQIKNETVETTVKVDVSYPQDTRIVPTETITIHPVIGQPVPAEGGEGEVAPVENALEGEVEEQSPVAAEVIEGITFELAGDVDGFTASVDDKSGALKVTASSGVEVGDTAEFSVLVSGTSVPVKVTVRSLSEEVEDPTPGDLGAEPAAVPVENVVTVDKHTYDELVEGNRAYNQILAKQAQEARHARVDKWVTEGRIAASARDEAIKVIDRDEKLAEDIYGSRAVNTIPRREIGNVGSGEPLSTTEALIAKANANRKNRK